MGTRLTLTLFGVFHIKIKGKAASEINTNKARAILAYLALEANRSHNRSILAEFFWPNKPEGSAKNSLKQALSILRKSLGDRESNSPFLLIDREQIQFNSGSDTWIDVNEFSRLIEESKTHAHRNIESCLPCVNRLRQAVELYQGDFLAQFSLPDSTVFEEWVVINREAFQRQMSDALRNLAAHEKHNGDYMEACRYAEQLVALEPWNEENHRELIALLAINGKRSQALKQFQTCQKILADELGVAPSEETTSLYEQVRDGTYQLPKTKSLANVEHSYSVAGRTFKVPLLISTIVLIGLLGISLLFGVQSSKNSQKAEISVNSNQTISGEEYQILEILYQETGGTDWKNTDGWLANDEPCTWFGVICRGDSVVGINLDNNNLNGNIPSELGDLNNLQQLNLSGNHLLSGPIPPELGNLKNLESLILSTFEGGTQLSGPIPPELGNLEKLGYLEIENSLVNGNIPPELGNLTKLTLLLLSNNPLSGSIPSELGNLVNLEVLAFGEGRNELSGALPLSLTNLKKLRTFQFHDTILCEPPGTEFQAWLEGIDELYRTGILCKID